MTEQLEPVLLAKWLAGRATPEECRVIEDWLAGDPTRLNQLRELRALWDRAGETLAVEAAADNDRTAAAAEAARWAAIQQAIGHRAPTTDPWKPSRTVAFPLSHRSRHSRWWLAAAAVIAIMLVGGGTIGRMLLPAAAKVQEFTAPAGALQSVTLTDGSHVTLAPGSRLTFVDKRRAGAIRSATLEGQAFFQVAHDARHPFLVTAGVVTTKVLGTEFNVRAYRDDESASVVLRSGKVLVTIARAPGLAEAILAPGEEARVDRRGRLQINAADLERTLAWTSGNLEFVGTELTAVLRDVNHWYGLQLRLADTTFAHHRVTVSFDHMAADSVTATLTRLLGPGVLTSSPHTGRQQIFARESEPNRHQPAPGPEKHRRIPAQELVAPRCLPRTPRIPHRILRGKRAEASRRFSHGPTDRLFPSPRKVEVVPSQLQQGGVNRMEETNPRVWRGGSVGLFRQRSKWLRGEKCPAAAAYASRRTRNTQFFSWRLEIESTARHRRV